MAFITVIMPVFNAAAYVAQAVASVLGQSLGELELIAIDDGSQDGSGAILDALAAGDPRMRVVHQGNAGVVAALNRGIDLALGRSTSFIAIMHADDIALPNRLRQQAYYLAGHSDIALCGTGIRTFGGQNPREWRYPEEPRFTKAFLLFWCCFAHPTMMFRRQVLEAGLRYDPGLPMPCEDYALWATAARTYPMANVPEVLLEYREHPGQGGAQHREKSAALTQAIRRGQIEHLGIVPTPQEMTLHQQLAESELAGAREFVLRSRAWLERLQDANTHANIYDPQALAKVLAGRWAAVCIAAAKQEGPGIWGEFWESPLAEHVDRTLEKNRGIPARGDQISVGGAEITTVSPPSPSR